jgi:hypothetical protein
MRANFAPAIQAFICQASLLGWTRDYKEKRTAWMPSQSTQTKPLRIAVETRRR